MNRILDRVSVLLAAAGFTEREAREFANSVAEVGPNIFLEHFSYARDMLRSIHLEQLERRSGHTAAARTSSGTLSKIERLLLEEANLPKRVAIDLLSKQVQKRYPSKQLPPESRKGFAAWIEKLSFIVSESELLHIATQIRNNFVHQVPSDWGLK